VRAGRLGLELGESLLKIAGIISRCALRSPDREYDRCLWLPDRPVVMVYEGLRAVAECWAEARSCADSEAIDSKLKG
jgi:hypothetical protein